MYKKLSKFIVVGAIGFFVDFAVYLLLLELGLHIYLSRLLAFFVAVQITYVLNQKLTFVDRKGKKLQYVIGQISGMAINYLSFILFYEYITINNSITAFISGSLIAMFYNFSIANFWVFKNKFED